MVRKAGTIAAAVVAALIGVSLAATAQETTRDTTHGVTVLRGNPVTSEGTAMGVGNGGIEPAPAPANAANGANQTGNVNAVRTGSVNAGGEIANPPPGGGR